MKNILMTLRELNRKKWLNRQRSRLRNYNPTIICNNCIAGIIYHDLGLRFNSPTINLFIKGQEYLEFVKNLEYYLTCDLQETHKEMCDYPVGKLISKDREHNDITIYFQHYHTFSEAKDKWTERVKRVDLNNIYYIWEFYDDMYDVKLLYEFDELPLKNKIALTHKQFPKLKNAFYISCYKDGKPVAKILEYKGLSGKRYLDEFDYVSFLNRP